MRALDHVISALSKHGAPTSGWLVGEPCFPPPEVMREALARASQAGEFGYAPPPGLPQLREVLSDMHTATGAATSRNQVVVTNGAKGGLLAVLATLLAPGDELIHPVPCYPAYPAMATLFGARPVPVAESDGSFDSWPQAVADAIGPRTRAVILSSPSNPTGATLTEAQARALVELCRDRNIRLICDEAYTEFREPAAAHILPGNIDPERRTVVQVRSASKSWALCGWRMGWVVADADLAAQVAARHAALLNPASGPAQEALTALPRVPGSYLEEARAAVESRLDALHTALATTGLPVRRPAGGFYFWLDVSQLIGDGGTAEFCIELASRHGVGLWPGEDFGGNGHVRLAVTAPASAVWDEAVGTLTTALTDSRPTDRL